MKKVRKSLLLCVLLACSAWAWAAVSPGVSFVLKSGGKVSFAFSERPVVQTASDAVSVSVGGTERVSYPYADVARIVFEEVEVDPTGISLPLVNGGDGAAGSHAVFAFDDGRLVASGLKAGERISVYSLSGGLSASLKAGSDGVATLSLSSLPHGVYAVRTQGGVSYKFMNR